MKKIGETLQEALPGQIRPENTESLSGGHKCPDCGRQVVPVLIPVLNRWILPACSCQVAKYLDEEERRQQQEKRARVERLFANSGLGPRFKSCTFENWQKRPGTEEAFKTALGYTDKIMTNINTGKGLLFFGEPGNGKSHLAAAVVNKALEKGFAAVFERVPMLLSRIRSTYRNGSPVGEAEIMRVLTQADLLTLDDAGAEKWTEWTEPTLYTIIDERYSYKKALIITTNSTLEELEKKIGIRAMDRILEMCEIVENRGASFRKERARTRGA
mgnify:CR=1 FL=1